MLRNTVEWLAIVVGAVIVFSFTTNVFSNYTHKHVTLPHPISVTTDDQKQFFESHGATCARSANEYVCH